jgi:hypothetical protein
METEDEFESYVSSIILQENVDVDSLKKLSRQKEGFRNSQTRKHVWPVLLGMCDGNIITDYKKFIKVDHKDHQQVLNDIQRSLWKQDAVQSWSSKLRGRKRKVLGDIILSILSRNPNLHYFQGLHDIGKSKFKLCYALSELLRSLRDFFSV